VLSDAHRLTLGFREHNRSLDYQDETNPTKWHNLLRPFTRVKTLCIPHLKLVGEISRALQLDNTGRFPDILPQLYELSFPTRVDHGDSEALFAFRNARQAQDRPTDVYLPGQPPGGKLPPQFTAYASSNMTSSGRNTGPTQILRASKQIPLLSEYHESSAYMRPKERTRFRN
jgi:hypothetical protein